MHVFSFVYFLKWSLFFGPSILRYFKSSSNTTLRLSICTVWPSLFIFFFHFYSFPADHSVKSLRDSSEGLFRAIFLPCDTPNIFVSPRWHWGEAGWGHSNLLIIHLFSHSSNDRPMEIIVGIGQLPRLRALWPHLWSPPEERCDCSMHEGGRQG